MIMLSTQAKVMDANLLLFKTVIAGDAWGEIAVPVIQDTCCFRFLCCFSIQVLVPIPLPCCLLLACGKPAPVV